MKKIVVVGVVVLFLVSCSTKFASHGDRLYLRSKNGPGVMVAPPLTDNNISHFYDLPAQPNKHPSVSVAAPMIDTNVKQESL